MVHHLRHALASRIPLCDFTRQAEELPHFFMKFRQGRPADSSVAGEEALWPQTGQCAQAADHTKHIIFRRPTIIAATDERISTEEPALRRLEERHMIGAMARRFDHA